MTPASFREWRRRLGLSQAEAAKALGISVRSVNLYETGLRDGGKRAVEVPQHIALACAAVAIGLPPHP